jgi:signal transduction histidine kinase
MAEGRLDIEVRNPLPPGTVVNPGRHGLTGMRERIADVGGTLEVGPQELANGALEWVVAATIPITDAGESV